MTYGKKIKQHEIVIPTDPLPVWYFVFHDHNSEKYIAPHWHRGIELSKKFIVFMILGILIRLHYQ